MTILGIDRHLDDTDLARTLAVDVRAGLTATPKTLPPKYFYDARGSQLFEQITRVPEYYPTRAERAILTAHADEIALLAGADTLVELGSGSSEKTHLLLGGMRTAGALRRYVPVDVSESALNGAVKELDADYPELDIHGVVADIEHHLHLLPRRGRRLVAFLGGTIGNLFPSERHRFLADVRASLRPGDTLVLGTDLVKDPRRLVAAYDDAAGITAEFNRNVLHVINRSLGADFLPETFDHVATWDATNEWIEMRLRAGSDHVVRIAELGVTVEFANGEEIRTEISAKFRPDTVASELALAGFAVRSWWTDPDGDFALTLATPTEPT
ncbi:L-histidine N(alpha)-methyltransferase [Actinobacteria bacterium YIM 96077]|uniref:Histidine N-alpha-methyltransferase n=1 Tax=Phytoactinopolyspora halophila TaxID=1981511 RepID=A0A329R066_9ACTN|nr:L-histidine N(alpha)-methyltransferase [Phytoactinopolyspora halophila]AYY13215.1 L-histidine N(alpha)-methyltransferase [Actinobacteria bacterium YIM 96077]RAW17546.1 L-histidine N(alpha)-methyltransferase [Phytoactinopolyspora halophila]